jgi:hypothetical protein
LSRFLSSLDKKKMLSKCKLYVNEGKGLKGIIV